MSFINVTIDFGEEMSAILGEKRMEAIGKVIAYHASRQAVLSAEVAISGAMRWPIALRPEVLVGGNSLLI